ncbi:MAG: hypothetical protein KDH15_14135 [Rhodocyclaceae bacterium]|nr:hypothetical protein [Rhodocyclaceae bacterium]
MPDASPRAGQFELIGRISLLFAVLATAGLVGVLLLARPVDGDYVAMIQTLSASRARLPGLMAVTSLLLVLGTALTTWLIALYSSFRVAGPLYRFCIDLEQGIRDGEVPPIRVRASDRAQEDARYLEETVADLYRRQDEISATVDDAAHRLRNGDREAVAAAGQRLVSLTDAFTL